MAEPPDLRTAKVVLREMTAIPSLCAPGTKLLVGWEGEWVERHALSFGFLVPSRRDTCRIGNTPGGVCRLATQIEHLLDLLGIGRALQLMNFCLLADVRAHRLMMFCLLAHAAWQTLDLACVTKRLHKHRFVLCVSCCQVGVEQWKREFLDGRAG